MVLSSETHCLKSKYVYYKKRRLPKMRHMQNILRRSNPNWTWRYIELNPEYDEYGADIPFVDFHPNRQRNSVIVQIIGLSVLFAIWGAFIIWLVYLHNKYGI